MGPKHAAFDTRKSVLPTLDDFPVSVVEPVVEPCACTPRPISLLAWWCHPYQIDDPNDNTNNIDLAILTKVITMMTNASVGLHIGNNDFTELKYMIIKDKK